MQIFAATEGFWDDIPAGEIVEVSDDLLEHMRISHQDILQEIAAKKSISDDLRARMKKAVQGYKDSRLAVAAR